MGTIIRKARADERLALIALQRRASLVWEDVRQILLDRPELIDLDPRMIARGQVFIGEADNTVAGFATIIPHDDCMELEGLFVDPPFWRRGIGSALVDHIAMIAREHGAQRLHVIANAEVEAFYHAAGFTQTGTHQTLFGPIALVMVRQL